MPSLKAVLAAVWRRADGLGAGGSRRRAGYLVGRAEGLGGEGWPQALESVSCGGPDEARLALGAIGGQS